QLSKEFAIQLTSVAGGSNGLTPLLPHPSLPFLDAASRYLTSRNARDPHTSHTQDPTDSTCLAFPKHASPCGRPQETARRVSYLALPNSWLCTVTKRFVVRLLARDHAPRSEHFEPVLSDRQQRRFELLRVRPPR